MVDCNRPEIKFVPKGWGFEKWIVNNKKYCGKILYFIKGKKCSLHFHEIKEETFYIQSGRIKLLYSDETNKILTHTNEKGIFHSGSNENHENYVELPVENLLEVIILGKGDNFHIPPGRVHQIIALEETELFEFSTTHEDSDSYSIVKGDRIG